jgi:hypothetical protein
VAAAAAAAVKAAASVKADSCLTFTRLSIVPHTAADSYLIQLSAPCTIYAWKEDGKYGQVVLQDNLLHCVCVIVNESRSETRQGLPHLVAPILESILELCRRACL